MELSHLFTEINIFCTDFYAIVHHASVSKMFNVHSTTKILKSTFISFMNICLIKSFMLNFECQEFFDNKNAEIGSIDYNWPGNINNV